jgi:hypothetical protein
LAGFLIRLTEILPDHFNKTSPVVLRRNLSGSMIAGAPMFDKEHRFAGGRCHGGGLTRRLTGF